MIVRPAEQGMTLVEVLIVLAIIGIAAGATTLGLGVATRGASTASEAARLASRLRLAADDAMLDDRAMAFDWDQAGYAFPGAPGNDTVLGIHSLPRGMRLVMPVTKGRLPLGVDGRGASFTARLESADDRWMVRYDGVSVTAAPVPKA